MTTPEEVAAAEASGFGVYVTTAGQQVVIDPYGPIPQVVVDDARATGLGPTSPPDGATMSAQAEAIKAVADRAADAGKRIVFVFKTGRYGDWDDNLLKETFYGAYLLPELRTGALGGAKTFEELRAALQARIDARPDPGIYQIVDLTS